ncbi:hypothetical protein M6B38_183770 [Iris pallida]|uniref:Uncharacterized protein n=1 Tax=Iris pallida TaxID=29817 RepID=A0AAX6EBU2_IRIPA|nr:hypothetical protein M6B38_197800 [Iris pallida]KAJ6804544.1 hypothetical protein M6B38_183770 [Iris pallida]
MSGLFQLVSGMYRLHPIFCIQIILMVIFNCVQSSGESIFNCVGLLYLTIIEMVTLTEGLYVLFP